MSAWSEKKLDNEWGLGGYFSFGVVAVVLSVGRAVALVVVSERAARRLYSRMLAALVRAPVLFFDTTPTGRILNRISKDVHYIDERLLGLFQDTLDQLMNVFSTIGVVAVVAPYFLLLLVPLTIVFFHLQRIYRAASREIKRLDSNTRSPVFANFEETIHGVEVIRAAGGQARWKARNDQFVDDNWPWYYSTFTSNQWLGLRLEAIGSCVLLFAALWVAFSHREIGAGQCGLILLHSMALTRTLMQLVRAACELELGMNSVERVVHYSRACNIGAEGARTNLELGTKVPAAWPTAGRLHFQGLMVRYRAGLDFALRGVDLDIRAGEKVGLVGRTGSGKSTLAGAALFRLVEPSSGTVLLDGVDFRTLGLRDLRSAISIVPQEPCLFNDTLRANLDPFGRHADDALWAALDKVELAATVHQLPEGLHTSVREAGANWSVGQRQLICLARVLLRRSRVLVMDEASAFIDIDTDNTIQRMVRQEFEGCTVLTVAHRLATIMDYDRVAVMDDGRIAECASPAELLGMGDPVRPRAAPGSEVLPPASLFAALVHETGPALSSHLRSLIKMPPGAHGDGRRPKEE